MRFIVGLLAVVTLAFGSGCAKQDWIDRTLVTVDVTGTWSGNIVMMGAAGSRDVVFQLEQTGSSVKGLVQVTPGAGMRPIEGTVAGDVFRFKDSRGNLEGELSVGGDEMNGTVSFFGQRPSLPPTYRSIPSPVARVHLIPMTSSTI
jgi:hypothetical protein